MTIELDNGIKVRTYEESFGLRDVFATLGNDSFDFGTLSSLDPDRPVNGTYKGVVNVNHDGVCPFAIITIHKNSFVVLHLKVNNTDDLYKISELDTDGVEPSVIVSEFVDSFDVVNFIVGPIDQIVVTSAFSVYDFHSILVDTLRDHLLT